VEANHRDRLTGQSAKDWLNPFASAPALGIALSLFATVFPPLDAVAETNLVIHMAQHFLIILGGILIGYSIYRNTDIKYSRSGKHALLPIIPVVALLIFWHLPLTWDAAVLNPLTHVAEHVSFLFVGLSAGIFLLRLSTSTKFILLFLAISAHTVYGIFLYIQTSPVYPLYPIGQEQLLGLAMFAPSAFYFTGYLALTLVHETYKIEAAEAKVSSGVPGLKISRRSPTRLSRPVMPVLTIILLGTIVGYFASAASLVYASDINSSRIANDRTVLVYIVESPVDWQYSPSNTRVVIGVNSTIVWVSHSLMRDTVTSTTGLFDSGPIDPGSTWTYHFTSPGIYEYHCIYHLWMKGSITVTFSSQ
jgi:plastocyanin